MFHTRTITNQLTFFQKLRSFDFTLLFVFLLDDDVYQVLDFLFHVDFVVCFL